MPSFYSIVASTIGVALTTLAMALNFLIVYQHGSRCYYTVLYCCHMRNLNDNTMRYDPILPLQILRLQF